MKIENSSPTLSFGLSDVSVFRRLALLNCSNTEPCLRYPALQIPDGSLQPFLDVHPRCPPQAFCRSNIRERDFGLARQVWLVNWLQAGLQGSFHQFIDLVD